MQRTDLSVASVRSSLISKQLEETKRACGSLIHSSDVKGWGRAVLSDSMLKGTQNKEFYRFIWRNQAPKARHTCCPLKEEVLVNTNLKKNKNKKTKNNRDKLQIHCCINRVFDTKTYRSLSHYEKPWHRIVRIMQLYPRTRWILTWSSTGVFFTQNSCCEWEILRGCGEMFITSPPKTLKTTTTTTTTVNSRLV